MAASSAREALTQKLSNNYWTNPIDDPILSWGDGGSDGDQRSDHDDPSHFTDINSSNETLTLEQLDYDQAKFPLDARDETAIEALAPGETYEVRFVEEDDGECPTWGTITRLPDDTTVRALVRDGAVLGMGFDDAAARQDAIDRDADPTHVATGKYVDGTLAALSGWGDSLIGPESVGLAADGRVRRIDVGNVSDGDKGTEKVRRDYE